MAGLTLADHQGDESGLLILVLRNRSSFVYAHSEEMPSSKINIQLVGSCLFYQAECRERNQVRVYVMIGMQGEMEDRD